jgi:hypothetical protein
LRDITQSALPAHLTVAGMSANEQEILQGLAAHGQKIVIRCIVLNFILRAAEKAQAFPSLVLQTLFFCVMIYSLVGVVRICSGLGESQNKKIVFMVLAFFPIVNLVALVYLSVRASKMLRSAGWTIGLFGARP